MKNQTLTVLCCALLCAACSKDYDPVPVPSKDSSLEGPKQDMTWLGKGPRKLFVLNEGGMGSNNASLDFLRFSDGAYVTGAFRKMNPGIAGGLGDVGNDIAVRGDELWIVVNNSGIVEVVSAEDGQEALEMLREQGSARFDLVLTDMWMPRLDGEGLVKAIRADSALSGQHVVVVTADVEFRAKFAEIGFDGILLKPVTRDGLVEMLDKEGR